MSGRRHGSQDTVVGCAADECEEDEQGWRLSDQVGPQSPAHHEQTFPSPAQAVSYQIYIHGCHSFPSCLAHRARAARECHPHHLSACATAAAVLCGFSQIWRVSLCVLRWAPKTAELQIRILMGFPRPWIDEMRGFGCADTMSSSGDRGLP